MVDRGGRPEEMRLDKHANPIPVLEAEFKGDDEQTVTFSTGAQQRIFLGSGVFAISAWESGTNDCYLLCFAIGTAAVNALDSDPAIIVSKNAAAGSSEDFVFKTLLPYMTYIALKPHSGASNFAIKVNIRRLY